jgi:dolichyl-diphosphooligosaccharide--protein glycosyltransferase
MRARLVTAGILIAFFALAMFIRCYWYFGPAVAPADTYGTYSYVVSGNDPDYHKRTIDYILDNGRHLSWDPLMNYPNGGPNPNPPAFAWSSLLFGMVMSPFYGFDVTQSVWMFFEILPAFWAAMTVFPVYYFTRDMFGRKPAYFAAFFIAVMAGNVERTPLGFSDHDSYTMFFAVTGFFFLMRALKNLEEKNWVAGWRSAADITGGTLELLAKNRLSLLYALLAGLSMGAIMLGWKGGTYLFAILSMYFLVHSWVKRFRREDPYGIAIVTLIAMAVPLIISFPYYYTMQFIHWYETPFFVFLATALLAAIVVVTREQPWMLVLGALAGMVIVAYLALMAFFPTVYNVLLGFQGYFIRDKLYTTIAEAQPPDFSRMVYSYGEYVFYFGLIAVVYSAWRLPKEHWRNDYIFTIMWCFMAIFMAMSAVRFMYNATPVFAILGGWVTWTIIRLLDYGKMAKTFRGLNEGRWIPRWHAVKSSVKLRHVAGAIFIGYMVVGGATWYGIDAGIPYETKKDFDKDIYNFLPSQLRPAGYKPSDSGLWWFGSFGTAFPSDYWTDGMFWFRTQDKNESPEDRPAFVAWWDYGHWCMHMGEHPSIADNFQQGVEISGSIITAQNESQAIAYYIARVAEGSTADKAVRAMLDRYLGQEAGQDFIDIEQLKDIPKWRAEIIKHPDIFGKRTKDMNDNNAKWAALQGILTSRLNKRELVDLYNELTFATGHEIRYFAADTRMFPFTATNTGIFYAPVKLSDQDINDFLTTRALGSDGQEYDPANLPESVRTDPDFQIQQYNLYYNMPFYNSMFYKAYIGYGPADVGVSQGAYGYTDIPSVVGTTMRTGQYPPMQGWNMSNFRLEYRTAYWNPYNESTGLANHSADWKVVPPWTSQKYQDELKGVSDLFYRNLYAGVFFLKYYHGAYVNGTVRTDTGKPVAGARVTVYDDLKVALSYYPGVPHGYAVTDSEGRYSLLAPYGNVTVKVTNGGMSGVDDQILLKERRELGTTTFRVSDDQAMRHELDLALDGIPDYNIRKDFTVNTSALNGRAYIDSNGDGSWTEGADRPLAGEVRAQNSTTGLVYTAALNETGAYRLLNLTPGDYRILVSAKQGLTLEGGTTGVDPGSNGTFDVKFGNFGVSGNLTFENGTPAANLTVGLLGGGRLLYSNHTAGNGSYIIDNVLPDTYNISVVTAGYYRENLPLSINQTENATRDMGAFPVYPVSGSTEPGTTVTFQNLESLARWVTVSADASGHYAAEVSPGNYTVYARALSGTGMRVSLGEWKAASRAAVLDIPLVPGVRVNGTVYRDVNGNGTYDVIQPGTVTPPTGLPADAPNVQLPEHQTGASVEIEGGNVSLFLPGNAQGYYEAWVPAGIYTLRAFNNVTGTDAFVNVTRLDMSAPSTLNLSLGKGVQVSGRMYWDRNSDDVPTDDEGADGGWLRFTDRKRPEISLLARATGNGTYTAYLPQIAEYTVALYGAGYTNGSDFITIGTESVLRNFKIEPRKTAFSAALMAGDESAPAGVLCRLVPRTVGGTADNLTTDARGVVSAAIMPGEYILLVDQNVTVASGPANLTSQTTFQARLGQEAVDVNATATVRFFLSGVAYHDENGDGVAQRAEYRNTLVKFIPEAAVADPATAAVGIPSDPRVLSVPTVEGRYDIALPAGNYTVWTLLSMPAPGSPDLVHIAHLRVERSASYNLPLQPGCNVRGTLYTDLNGNGVYEAGENRGGVGISASAGGPALLTVASDPSGYFELTLPQGGNFTLGVHNTTNETLSQDLYVPILYLASVRVQTPSGRTLDMNLSVARQIGVAGRVSYDRNQNGTADAGEGVGGAVVAFANATGTEFTAAPDADGNYTIFLPQAGYNVTVRAPGYNTTVTGLEHVNVSLDSRSFGLALSARNTTVAFRVYPPGASGEPRLPGGATVELRALDGRGQNASGRTDVNGRLALELAPGVYSLLVRLGGDLHYGALDVAPAGTAVDVRVDLGPATRLWGSAFLNGTSGPAGQPGWVNLTFNTTLGSGGQNYRASLEFPGSPAVYELWLPAGNFSASALYTTVEGAFNLTYNASRDLDIGQNDASAQWDIPLGKVKDHSIGLKWDESEKATISVNGTVNYTLLLSNLGNEKFTVNIDISKPGGWSVNLSLKKVELAPGENVTVTANITASPTANAGDNIVTINASSSELGPRFFNVSRPTVHVTQFYGLELGTSGAATAITGGVDYTFKLTNRGNGLDTFNLSVSGPHGWNLTLSDYNPQVSGGEGREFRLTAQPFAGARIEKGLQARISALSSHSSKAVEITVNLTFPKVTAGEVKVSGPSVSETNAAPGFEAVAVLAAAVLVAAISRRRWRR